MKSNYDVGTYAEAFDAHNEFTGAIYPEGLAAEFRGICEDADKEIFSLKQRAEETEAKHNEQMAAAYNNAVRQINDLKAERDAAIARAERAEAVAVNKGGGERERSS